MKYILNEIQDSADMGFEEWLVLLEHINQQKSKNSPKSFITTTLFNFPNYYSPQIHIQARHGISGEDFKRIWGWEALVEFV
jgi:hypothetical protein